MTVVVDVPCPPCPVCGNGSTVTVLAHDYARWRDGELVQRAFPEMPPADRELLVSGTHSECWTVLFGVDDEPWG